MKKADAILTADRHLREDQPICRLDDFFETQSRKIKWLRKLQEKHDCPVLDAGDLFNKWRGSHYLARWSILNLPDDEITLWGNHDTPYHSHEQYEKSILGVLEAANVLTVLFDKSLSRDGLVIHPFSWGKELTARDTSEQREDYHIALCHVMTYTGRKPYPGCTAPGAHTLLKQMQGFDLIVTGHNHTPFVVEHDDRLLVNPGSLTRQTADQADHKPRVYLWYAEDNHVEPVFVPIEDGVINRDHIDDHKERENRMNAFVESLNGDFKVSLSFQDNMEKFLETNRIRRNVKQIIWEVINGTGQGS